MSVSPFTQVLNAAELGEDRHAVESYASFLMNTWEGARPSDCARRAVREYRENPDRIRNRPVGEPPR